MNKLYMIINLFFLFVVTNHSAWAKEENLVDGTLCFDNEVIYFTCSLENKKIVSMCGSPTQNPQLEGYVQYRYGVPNKIEMKYPDKLVPAKGHIFYVNESGGSINSMSLFFEKAEYFYAVGGAGNISSLRVEIKKPLKNEEINENTLVFFDKKEVLFQRCLGNPYDSQYEVKRPWVWEDLFQDGKEYYWTGKNKPM